MGDQIQVKIKKMVEAVKRQCDSVVDICKEEVCKALRAEALKRSISLDKLFDELSKKTGNISEAAFCKKIQGLEGLPVSITAEQAKLLHDDIAMGSSMSKRHFLTFVQVYYKTVKDIAFSDVFEVGSCKTLRKAEQGEVIEILEGPVTDEKVGLVRIKGRSMIDSMEGWVTVKGNQGTPFMEKVDKIFYCCRKADVPVQKAYESSSDAIRTLGDEEILELLEGPRKEVLPDAQRGRVKTSKDSQTGWITFKDRLGVVYAEANSQLYTCSTTVAMTDGEDIKNCKVVRKLAEGEFFQGSGPVVEDSSTGVSRLPGKALSDGKEGWITLKGNAGTVYAEAATKYYAVKKEVQLEKRFQSAGADSIRKLEVGETFQVLEGPRDEKVHPEVRAKVRCLRDGTVGWISKKAGAVKDWNSTYKCLDKVSMYDSRAGASLEESKVVRELQKGESVEMIEGPVEDDKDVKMKCRALKDGLAGWVTLKAAGKRLLDQ